MMEPHLSQFWMLEIQHQGACVVGFLVRALLLTDSYLLFISSHGRERRSKLSHVSSYKDTNPITTAYSHVLITFQIPISNTIILGIRVTTYECKGDTYSQSIAGTIVWGKLAKIAI